MSVDNTPKRVWHAFARQGDMRVEVGEGLNASADGPERLVGSLVGFSPADACMALGAPRLASTASALIDRDCIYDGARVIIPCDSHAEAMRLVRELRDAVNAATIG